MGEANSTPQVPGGPLHTPRWEAHGLRPQVRRMQCLSGAGHPGEGQSLSLSRSPWQESQHQEPVCPWCTPPHLLLTAQPQPGQPVPPASTGLPTINTDAQRNSWGRKKQVTGQWVTREAPRAVWSLHNLGETSEGPQGLGWLGLRLKIHQIYRKEM